MGLAVAVVDPHARLLMPKRSSYGRSNQKRCAQSSMHLSKRSTLIPQAQLKELPAHRSSDGGDGHADTRAVAAAAAAAEQLAERGATIQKLMSERAALKYQLENETRRRVSVEARQLPSKDALRIDVPNGLLMLAVAQPVPNSPPSLFGPTLAA